MVKLLLVVLSFTIVMSVSASTDIQYGFSPGFSQLKLSDPDGPTQNTSVSTLSFNTRFKTSLRRYSYWLTAVSYEKASLSASSSNIGQKTARWNFSGGFETRVPVTRKFDFYVAGLIGVSQAEYASRHTVDEDGFLAERFSKRSSNSTFIKVQATYYKKLNKNWLFGAVPAYEYSLDDGFSGPSLSAVFYY